MYLTDIHQPTLDNLNFNAKKNHLHTTTVSPEPTSEKTSVFNMDRSGATGSGDTAEVVPPQATAAIVEVLNLNWKDSATYPAQAVDVILGADLVYDAAILHMLVPAIDAILVEGVC